MSFRPRLDGRPTTGSPDRENGNGSVQPSSWLRSGMAWFVMLKLRQKRCVICTINQTLHEETPHEQTPTVGWAFTPVLTSCPGSLTAQSVLSSPQQWHVKESCFPSPIVTRLSSWTLSAAATAPAASAVSGRLSPVLGARQVAEVTAGGGATPGGSWPSTVAELAASAVPSVFRSTAKSSASMSSSSPSRFRLPLLGGAGALALVGDISWGRDPDVRKTTAFPVTF